MADYPLFFTLTNEIRCDKFAARVVSHGRALMVFEDGEWWCHGVEPGGLTEHGNGSGMAYAAFKAAFGQILEDLARDADSLEAFESAVKEFIADSDSVEAERWESARRAIRSGSEVEWPFDNMKRATGGWDNGVSVSRLEQVEAGEEAVALADVA